MDVTRQGLKLEKILGAFIGRIDMKQIPDKKKEWTSRPRYEITCSYCGGVYRSAKNPIDIDDLYEETGLFDWSDSGECYCTLCLHSCDVEDENE